MREMCEMCGMCGMIGMNGHGQRVQLDAVIPFRASRVFSSVPAHATELPLYLCISTLLSLRFRIGFFYDGMLYSFRRDNLALVTTVYTLLSHFLSLISPVFHSLVHYICKYQPPPPEMEPAFDEPSASVSSSGKGSMVEDKLVQSLAPIDEASEKKLLRKCDLHVVPIISLLYVLSFLDRINIGNARIQGLEKDLHMSGPDYNIALMVFFIPYILFEVPSNILIRKLRPSTWLSMLMVCWGMAAMPKWL